MHNKDWPLLAEQVLLLLLLLKAQVLVEDPDNAAAFCNYGNVMRELGHPQRAVPFMQHAILLDPTNITAQFNLAVAYLLMGDYSRGWAQ